MATKEKVILAIKTEAARAIKDLAKFNKELLKSNKSTKTSTKSIIKWTAGLAVTGLAMRELTKFMGESVKAASALEEQTNKFNVVFEDVQASANSMADALVEGFGLSQRQAKELLGSTGDLLTGFGFLDKEALSLSGQVQELAIDLASFQDLTGGVERASNALTKGLLGEREMLKELGIVIREADVEQQLLLNNQTKLTGAALLRAKAEATLQIAQRQSTKALGDAKNTFDSHANVMRRVEAKSEDLKASLGVGLKDAMTQLGLAFIGASGEGGALRRALTSIVSVAAGAIKILGRLIDLLNKTFDKKHQARIKSGEIRFKAVSKAQDNLLVGAEKRLAQLKKTGASNDVIIKQLTFINNLKIRQGVVEKEIVKATEKTNEALKELNKTKDEQILKDKNLQTRRKQTVSTTKDGIKELQKAEEEFTAFISTAQENRINKEVATREKLLQFFGASEVRRAEILRVSEENIQLIKDEFREAEQQKSIANFQLFLNDVQTIGNSIAAVFAQSQRNQTLSLQLEQKKRQKAIAKDFDAQIAAAEKAGKDTTQLEKDKKEALGKLDDEFDARSRALVRKQAILGKKIAISQAIMNTAQGATKALAQGGFFGGPVMAGIIAALGAIQVNLIRQQPIPEAQEGALIPGSSSGTLLRAGENNKPEAIIPLTDPEASNALGGVGMTVIVNIENNFGGEIGPEFAESMDRALTDLDKDSNSTFAEVLRT